jgi:hypothetical protein
MFKIAEKTIEVRKKLLEQLEQKPDINSLEKEKLLRRIKKAENTYNNNILFIRGTSILASTYIFSNFIFSFPKLFSLSTLIMGGITVLNVYYIKPSAELQKKNYEINENIEKYLKDK